MQTDAEFLKVAMHCYDNIQCNSLEEFNEDLNRIQVVRKMILRYKTTGELSTRLALNHIVVLFNVFGSKALDLILYKFPKDTYPILFSFFLFLNRATVEQLKQAGAVADSQILQELERL